VRTVRLLIAFDGTRYEGWQSQRKEKTVQEVFEKVLERILKEKVHLTSSSRTDSGVHAEGLVAHFRTKNQLPDPKIRAALNFYLPKDIVVRAAKTVPMGFHAQFGARSKLYRYSIRTGLVRPLFDAPYVFWYPNTLNVARMRQAARHLEGKHDFSAFRGPGNEDRSAVRTVKRLTIRKEGSLIQMEIEGDGFLRHMVRIIAGTLIDVGRKKLDPADLPKILASKDRSKAGRTAKSHGLTLVRVSY